MLKVERLNIESPMERSTVLYPEIRHHYQDYLNDDNENNDDEDYHMAVQSKWTISHLLGLKAIESANSIPCIETILMMTNQSWIIFESGKSGSFRQMSYDCCTDQDHNQVSFG